jgi:8-oxo-dGTP diphosphatase
VVLVVGAAVVRDGFVLAARRTRPPAAAGRWELPGGKVEPGESPEDALVREVGEELGCTVRVLSWLHGRAPVGPGLELAVALVDLVAGDPVPTEHDRVRWLSAAELSSVDWLEPDRPFLPQVRASLGREGGGSASGATMSPVRAIFFDPGEADAAADRLRADGYRAHVQVERLAGEDDDEDHPRAVVSDAPAFLLEALVERHDGWLDTGEGPTRPRPAPPPLPSGPRRLRGPAGGGDGGGVPGAT